MVKSYLRYHYSGSAGTICTPECSILLDDDGKHIFTGTNESVSIWNSRTGGLESKLTVKTSFPDPPFNHQATCMAKHPLNSKMIAVGYSNGSIRLWDISPSKDKGIPHGLGSTVRGARDIVSFKGHKNAVTSLTFNDDGSHLVSGGQDTDIVVWDVEAESGLYRLRGHSGPITDLIYLSDGILASSSKDGSVRVWHCATQSGIQVLADHPAEVWSLCMSPKKDYLFAAGAHSWIRLYELDRFALDDALKTDGKISPDVKIAKAMGGVARPWGSKDRVQKMVILPVQDSESESAEATGGLLICQTTGKAVEMFKLQSESDRTKKLKRRIKRLKEKTKSKQNKNSKNDDDDSDEDVDVVAGLSDSDQENDNADSTTDLPSLPTEIGAADIITALYQLRLPSRVRHLDLVANLQTFAVSLENNSVEVHKIAVEQLLSFKGSFQEVDATFTESLGAPVVSRVSMGGHATPPRIVQVTSDDLSTVTFSSDAIRVFNNRTLACSSVVPLPIPAACGLLLPSNDAAIVGCVNGDLLLVDLAVGEVISSVPQAHPGGVRAMCLHPTKGGCATVGADKKVGVWRFGKPDADGAEGAEKTSSTFIPSLELLVEDSLTDEPTSVCFSPSPKACKHLAIGLLNNTIDVRYADSLKPFLTLYGHQLPVTSVSISSDGSLLASASADKTIKLWGLDFGDCHVTLRGHKDSVTHVTFLPLTHYILTASRDASVKWWDCDARQLVTTFEGHRSAVSNIATGSDGAFFVSAGSMDKSIRLWNRGEQQLFIQEERAMEFDRQLEEEATRDDLDGHAAKEVASMRPTRRTVEAVRNTEKLMEVIDDAVEAYEEEIKYREEVREWRQRQEDITNDPTLTAFTSSKAEDHQPPAPPALKWQFEGRTAHQHVLHMLRSIPASNMHEVVIALPFSSACVLLKFIMNALQAFESANEKRQVRLERAKFEFTALMNESKDTIVNQHFNQSRHQTGLHSKRRKVNKTGEDAEDELNSFIEQKKAIALKLNQAIASISADLIFERTSIEMPCRIAMSLIQLHLKQLRTSDTHRPLLVGLRRVLQPLISRELKINEEATVGLECLMREARRESETFLA